MEGYDVVACEKCGFAFADNIPDQPAFDAYYAAMSKYENSNRQGESSETELERFRQVADLLCPALKEIESILDVGCATGGLLAELKKRGYSNLQGIDPSPVCAEAAQKVHGINVRALPIRSANELDRKYDVIILIGVLEHLRDLNEALAVLSSLLLPDGKFYLEVPDATRYSEWFSAPFQFFSMEHVNFFSPSSISSLMAGHGFITKFTQRALRQLGPKAVEPCVAGLFEKSYSSRNQWQQDGETEPALRKYIESSRALDLRISETIERLALSSTPLLVWGTGTHTLRLLKTSALATANIRAFIDSNSRYHGKTLHGLPILSPEQAPTSGATVLISSHVAEEEIKHEIIDRLHWPNSVVCLYENAPVEQP